MDEPEVQSLSVVQERAALLLANGARCREVARQVGVTEQTVGRWRKQTPFIDALFAAKECMDATLKAQVENSTSLMMECKGEALEVVRRHLHSDNPVVALKAAEILLKA